MNNLEINNSDIIFSEIITYYHTKTLHNIKPQLLLMCEDEENNTFEKNAIYDFDIFEKHLSHIKYIGYLDNITSAVCRCVEYGFKDQLILLLKELPRMLNMEHGDIDTTGGNFFKEIDKRLLLRKVGCLECYTIAKNSGFIDTELEKKVLLIQNLIKKKDNIDMQYTGPTPEEYGCRVDNCILSRERYFGYRHTKYYLLYNKKYRYKIVDRIFNGGWQGDCRYQAYVDTFKEDEEVINKYMWGNEDSTK